MKILIALLLTLACTTTDDKYFVMPGFMNNTYVIRYETNGSKQRTMNKLLGKAGEICKDHEIVDVDIRMTEEGYVGEMHIQCN